MMKQVAIVGGGMVGLSLANALAQSGISVSLYEVCIPQLSFDENPILTDGSPARVSAMNLHTKQWLTSIGAWSKLNAVCAPTFKGIEAWVQAQTDGVKFNAADVGRRSLGVMVQNREVVRVLWEMAIQNKLIKLHCPSQLSTLDNLKSQYELIIGADGANSWVRQQSGMSWDERAYGHHAIVATVKTTTPHQQIAYQHFMQTGPLGILPLHDEHMMSIVWSANIAESQRLMSLDDQAFNMALTNALDCRLGLVSLLSKRIAFPLLRRHVKNYFQSGVVLLGDAAHTIHPLAGQGVNLGFKDAELLAKMLSKLHTSQEHLFNERVLRQFERERRADNQFMQCAMSGLLALFCESKGVSQTVVNYGLRFVNQNLLLRRLFTQIATL